MARKLGNDSVIVNQMFQSSCYRLISETSALPAAPAARPKMVGLFGAVLEGELLEGSDGYSCF